MHTYTCTHAHTHIYSKSDAAMRVVYVCACACECDSAGEVVHIVLQVPCTATRTPHPSSVLYLVFNGKNTVSSFSQLVHGQDTRSEEKTGKHKHMERLNSSLSKEQARLNTTQGNLTKQGLYTSQHTKTKHRVWGAVHSFTYR